MGKIMPLDPNIYSQLQPNLAMGLGDVVNRYVDQTQADAEKKNRLAQMAQAGELQGLQLQQAKQQAVDEAALRQAYKESGGDTSGMVQKLRAQGLHAQADQLIKAQAEQQKANMEFALKRHEGLATTAGDIANNPTQWQAVIQNSIKAGMLHPDDANTMMQHFSTLPPEQIAPEAQKGMVMVKDASAKMAEQLYPNKNPEKFADANQNLWMTGPDQKIVPVVDPKTGKQMKAPLPASLQLSALQANPDNVRAQVDMIKAGQAPMPTGRQAQTPAGQKIIQLVHAEAPNISAQTYPTLLQTENAFAKGKQGDIVRSINVAFNHIETAEKLGEALKNGDTPAFNAIANQFATMTGKPAPTNFNAVKDIVADEIIKGVVGGTAALQDRVAMAEKIRAASSPEQLQGVMGSIKELLVGQHEGLRQQYEAGTSGFGDFSKYEGPRIRAYREAQSAKNTPTNTALSPEDQAAIQWAQANKNDPRAVKILSLHGMK
jgi:hypothetical protein